jgi:preprotein translocase subunit SecG
MENALLILHLVLVVFLVAIVLLQRSEGGALGMGGGGGGVVTGRGATSALQKATWYLAIGFLATSLALTILATTERSSGSVFDADGAGIEAPVEDDLPLTFTPPALDGDDAGIVPAAPATGGTAPAPTDPDNLVPVVPAQ